MKLFEAIARIDKLKHNNYSKEEKLRWLSTLDGLVKALILDTHAGCKATPFLPYNTATPDDTLLLVPAPYDELYLWWLAAQIDYYNGEMTAYNNSIALFNTGYSVFADAYHRQNPPLPANGAFR